MACPTQFSLLSSTPYLSPLFIYVFCFADEYVCCSCVMLLRNRTYNMNECIFGIKKSFPLPFNIM